MQDIPGYEGLYAATEDGSIFSKKQNRVLKTSTKNWYSNVRLCKNGIQTAFKVHQLIALCYLPKPNGKAEINHKNGIKSDNRVENLEWISRSENIKHSYRVLLREPVKGDKHPKHIPILNISTGIFYQSCLEAANSLNLPRNKVKCAMFKYRQFKDLLYV